MYYDSYLSVTERVDGGWSDFEDWSDCSLECGEGTRTRSRSCTNPAKSNGGADCVGNGEETEPCNTDQCPGIQFYVVIQSIKYL